MNHIISTFENFLKPTNSFFKFLVVGIINTCIGLTVIFFLLNVLHTGYWPATFLGNAIGAAVSYILNRKFTFQSKTSVGKSSLKFLLVILICYFGAYSLSDLIIDSVFQRSALKILTSEDASVLLGSALYTFANYLGQKYFVFIR
ncbi:GtrA family protein [Fictibacillus phosphorivorans]|uniref:GtrA family protein n=1 Tax=Fictibacillus phosphorivorans TaxID=1221500 RepID=UPI002041E2FD|nr:GtrA family protein [Fictibacillus phosphorivorans]MCM3719356.1 GtrA family protein [Fictibacillus phosphorivorans]MCM3776977.1 GtrA family protein [Fictibacillus phosphorivorans]